MSSGSNLAGARDRKWLPIHIDAKALGEEICMPLQAAIQCRSSLDEQRKLHGKHGLPIQKLPKCSQGCLLAMHLAQLILRFCRNFLF